MVHRDSKTDTSFTEAVLTVRPLTLQDMGQMCHWGEHEDLRYQAYNFPYKRPLDLLLWYKSKKRPFLKYIFGAFVDGRMVGYITLKQINWLKREAYMGICFDPALLGRGYGTTALKAYLEQVEQKYGMKKIFLKTACFNHRGQRCYEKVGFVPIERRYEPYEDQSQPFELLLKYGDFQMVENEIWTEYIYMVYEMRR